MGAGSRVTSVFFHVFEIICAAVVAGTVGWYLHAVDNAGAHVNSRLVYTQATAGISLFLSLILIVPLRYSFLAFPLNFILFVMWMVAFGLLVNVRPDRSIIKSSHTTVSLLLSIHP